MNANPNLAFLETRERFLPVPTASILERILEDDRFSAVERGQFEALFRMIQARFHFEFLERVERLKALYDPFDPDRDTLPLRDPSPRDRDSQFAELKEAFQRLLVEGNYVELTREQLVACLESRNHLGLAVRVNLDEYQDLRVFYRGVRQQRRSFRAWTTLWRKQDRMLRVFSRVGLLVRTAKPRGDAVLLKLFKDVVVEDLQMTSPHVQLRMCLFDRLKLGSTVAGGLFAPILKVVMAAAISPMLLLIVVGGFVGALLKGVFGFLRCKTKYMQKLSTSLYFQNLANNVSALTRLIDAAEAEETKETLLAYFLLYVERDRDYTAEALDRRVEQWLRRQFDVDADFEVDDAVRKLIEKDLVVQRADGPPPGNGSGKPRPILKVYDLPTALRKLDTWWDDYFTADREGGQAADRLAEGNWPPFPEAVRPAPTMHRDAR